MLRLFDTLERIKPAYDIVYRTVMLLCKVLLVFVIGITTMAVIGRYISWVPDPAWSEEVVLGLMGYIAVLSAALAIRRRAHIRMTAFDKLLPKKFVVVLDIISDIFLIIFALIMVIVGWRYARAIGARGYLISLPTISRFWVYFPIPLAGVGMLAFLLESILGHFRVLMLPEKGEVE